MVSNTGSNLRAGLTQPELFWSICVENSCCCVHTRYPSPSLCTIPRATVPPVTHWDGPCRLLRCLTRQQQHRLTACSAPSPSPAQSNRQEAISGNTVSNLHSWDFLLSCAIRGHKNFDKSLTESLCGSVKTPTAKSKSQWPD